MPTAKELEDKFWKALESDRTVMLGLVGAEDADLRVRLEFRAALGTGMAQQTRFLHAGRWLEACLCRVRHVLLEQKNAHLPEGKWARFVPVAALILAATTQAVPMSQEEAAAVSGAGWLRTMRAIVLPQMRLGIVAAWVVVFVLAFGELGASILIAPPGEATLPIRVYTIIANTPASQIAVLALLQALVIFAPVAALGAAASLREAK